MICSYVFTIEHSVYARAIQPVLMCSAGEPDGLGLGSESCSDCGWSACAQTGRVTGRKTSYTGNLSLLLGYLCSGCPNGVGVVLGALGVYSSGVGGVHVATEWEGKGWLLTRWLCEGVTSARTMGSVSGTGEVDVNEGGEIWCIHETSTQIVYEYSMCVFMTACLFRTQYMWVGATQHVCV